jgi:hypothetical protein
MQLMSLCLCGIPLFLIGGGIPLFFGVSYLRGSEWLWQLERRQFTLWGELTRENWEDLRRFKGFIFSVFGIIFLFFGLVMLFNSFQ